MTIFLIFFSTNYTPSPTSKNAAPFTIIFVVRIRIMRRVRPCDVTGVAYRAATYTARTHNGPAPGSGTLQRPHASHNSGAIARHRISSVSGVCIHPQSHQKSLSISRTSIAPHSRTRQTAPDRQPSSPRSRMRSRFSSFRSCQEGEACRRHLPCRAAKAPAEASTAATAATAAAAAGEATDAAAKPGAATHTIRVD